MNPIRIVAVIALMLAAAFHGAAQQPKAGEIRRGKIVKIDVEKYTLTLKVDGKDLDLVMAEDTQVLDRKGAKLKDKLDGFKVDAEVNFVARQKDGKNYLTHIRLFGGKRDDAPVKVDLTKLIPINELGDKEYQGYKGGFYPDGKNQRPKEHELAGIKLAKEIKPLNVKGAPDPKGRIVMISVGMSNTSQASQGFGRALTQPLFERNSALLFINGAQGGMTAARIQDPDTADGVKYWREVGNQLSKNGIAHAQVQIVWIKQADAGPTQGFPKYAKTLETELAKIVQILPKQFPNVKMAYLSSRTFGGYATTKLNPEPYAYESAFSVKWLIERQIKGDADLNFDPAKGAVKAPWLSWGPYLWANGSTKRTDGFSYDKGDFTANDGTHLTRAGQDKIGWHMAGFFQRDPTSSPWFTDPRKK